MPAGIFFVEYSLSFTSKGFLILLLPVLVVESLRVVTWVPILFCLGTDAESHSENESDNDDSVLDKNWIKGKCLTGVT